MPEKKRKKTAGFMFQERGNVKVTGYVACMKVYDGTFFHRKKNFVHIYVNSYMASAYFNCGIITKTFHPEQD